MGLLDDLMGTLLMGALAGFPCLLLVTSFGSERPTPERRNLIKQEQISGGLSWQKVNSIKMDGW